ncbi:MAG: cell division protein ZapA [Pseudomonadota bacterium]
MPELTIEIGGRLYEVACEPGQEASLEAAAKLLDSEAQKIPEEASATTEKRMLLLAGLMMADVTLSSRNAITRSEQAFRDMEERARIAEAKAAMLAAKVASPESEAELAEVSQDAEQLRAENAMAVELLSKVLNDIHTLAKQVETGKA